MFVERRIGDQLSLRQPGHAISIVKTLSQSRKEGLLCDVVLIVDEKRYNAHKMILASCSEYFKVMFTSKLAESSKNEIKIESITSEIFDQLMEYFYEGTYIIDMYSITDMLHASSLLLLKDIENQCYSYLRENINVNNCIQIKNLAESFSNKDLIFKSNEYIKKNFEKLSKEKELCNLGFSDFKSLLLSNDIICKSEDTVACVIEKWLQNRLQQDGNVIRTVLKSLRHPFLTQDGVLQFINAMKELDVKFDTTDYSKILSIETKLQSRSSKKLSINCRTSQKQENVLFCISLNGDVYCYNVANKKSYQLTKCPFMGQPGEITVHNDIIYLCGGTQNNAVLYNFHSSTLCSYNPAIDKWKIHCNMKNSRSKHCVVFLQDKLYAIGGTDLKNKSVKTSVECYDPVTQTWSDKPTTLTSRVRSCAAASEKYIYVMGGESSEGGIRGLSSVEKYCPIKEAWTVLPELNHQRISSSAVYFNSKVYVFGGSNGVFELQSFEYLESNEKKWVTVVIPYSSPISVSLVLDDKILAMGATNWGDELCLQYSFVRRRGVKWKVLRDFIHNGHRVKNFRYAIIKMLNYDLGNKLEIHCDCTYTDTDSDEVVDEDFNSSSDGDGWFDHDPFGIWI